MAFSFRNIISPFFYKMLNDFLRCSNVVLPGNLFSFAFRLLVEYLFDVLTWNVKNYYLWKYCCIFVSQQIIGILFNRVKLLNVSDFAG